jgi:hypothetical protein
MVMTFPNDPEQRKRFDARWREFLIIHLEEAVKRRPEYQGLDVPRLIGQVFGSLLAPLGGFSVLRDAPAFGEMMDRLRSRAWPGSVAGGLLLNLLQLRAANLPASVNKAIAIEEEYLSGVSTTGFPGAGKNERYIRDCWAEFKPVCHLWAALRVWEAQGSPDSFSPVREDSVEAFLAVAQAMRVMGLSLQSSSRKEPILKASEMWYVSRRFTLPTVRLKIPPLEDWKLEVLQRRFKSLR